MAARLQAAHAQNTALLEQLNSVSHVGGSLRSALAAAPPTAADWKLQPPHPSGGQPPERRHSPAVAPQPLYAGYPHVAQADFRRALPLDALLAQPGASAARNAGRGEEGEVAAALRRSVDAASLITFGTAGAVKQMY